MKKGNPYLVVIIIYSFCYFVSGADIFKSYTPRAVCMFWETNLISLHLVGNSIVFLSYMGMGTMLYMLYLALKDKGIPFTEYLYRFGGFIFFCGLTHLFGVINLFKTWYWIDGFVLLATAWFSILVFLLLIRDFKKMKEIKSPKEIQEMKIMINKVIDTIIHNN